MAARRAIGKLAHGWRIVPVMLLAVLLLGACLEDAEDKCFTFDNTNDANQTDACVGGEPTDSGSGSSGDLSIALVSAGSDVVIISNSGTTDQDMEGWTLTNEDSTGATEVYTFASFTLFTGNIVRVHSTSGSNDIDDLYWDGGSNWITGDTASLIDDTGETISSCDETDACWGS